MCLKAILSHDYKELLYGSLSEEFLRANDNFVKRFSADMNDKIIRKELVDMRSSSPRFQIFPR